MFLLGCCSSGSGGGGDEGDEDEVRDIGPVTARALAYACVCAFVCVWMSFCGIEKFILAL